MSLEQYANNAASVLAAAMPDAIGTTLTVASASTFPTVPQFRLRIDAEIVLVTAVAGAVFTVTRGAEGTTAASHAQGAPCTHILTAGALKNLSSSYSPVAQTAWFIDYVNGTATGDGSVGNPCASAAALYNLWQGGMPGRRPQLQGLTYTVTIVNGTAAFNDPLAVLFDVDMTTGCKLIFTSAAGLASLSGTLASASAFARTTASGQIAITDSGVANYQTYAAKSTTVSGLFHDKTTGAIGWLYEPQGASATGKVSPGRTALVAGTSSTPTPVSIATADQYEVLTLPQVYLGATCTLRQFPAMGAANASGIIFLYRLWCTSQGSVDYWQPESSSDVQTSALRFEAQECRFDQPIVVRKGNTRFYNCAFTNVTGLQCTAGGFMTVFAGFSYGKVVSSGGIIKIDGDFLLDGNVSLSTTINGYVSVGNFSRWGTTGPAFSPAGGTIEVVPTFEATGITYGTVGAGNAVIQFSRDLNTASLSYSNASTCVSQFQWDSTGAGCVVFQIAGSNNNTAAWAYNQSTGRYAGAADGTSTTVTFAAMDAAVNAPGFGGTAIDPTSGNLFFSSN